MTIYYVKYSSSTKVKSIDKYKDKELPSILTDYVSEIDKGNLVELYKVDSRRARLPGDAVLLSEASTSFNTLLNVKLRHIQKKGKQINYLEAESMLGELNDSK